MALAYAHLERTTQARVLDAGCGRRTHLEYGPSVHVTGLDASSEAMAANPRLDEAIVGDLETHALPPDSFDLVVCWDVLEHLRRPARALDGFRDTLRPGGMLLVAKPNARSLKGLVTRFTPHGFHRWVYRRARGPQAPEPFRTYMRWSVAPRPLAAWALARGLEVVLVGTYEAPLQRELRERLRLTGALWKALDRGFGLATAGRVAAEATELVLVAQRASSR
jgi:SAM-dependent methyltransferase